MDEKVFTIAEVADNIGISKATVYNKLNSLKGVLRNHIKVRKGVKYLTSEGIDIIKNTIGLSEEQFKGLNDEQRESHKTPDTSGVSNGFETLETDKKYLESLESQLEYLKSIIAEKDKQIGSLTDALGTAQRLNENSQVLLKQEQEKNQLLLGSCTGSPGGTQGVLLTSIQEAVTVLYVCVTPPS